MTRKMHVQSMLNRHNDWTTIARIRSANECARASNHNHEPKKILDYEEPKSDNGRVILVAALIGLPIIAGSFLLHGASRIFGIWLGCVIPLSVIIGKWLGRK